MANSEAMTLIFLIKKRKEKEEDAKEKEEDAKEKEEDKQKR